MLTCSPMIDKNYRDYYSARPVSERPEVRLSSKVLYDAELAELAPNDV